MKNSLGFLFCRNRFWISIEPGDRGRGRFRAREYFVCFLD